ncbi:sigma-70 family RNA polymerase sigma factor [Arthrobacter ipis]|uniref:RNA polymerase sigma factor n=1 Tax=Arthrobacter ipis TaxID=2716202 RepID=UPI00288A5F5C|nr:sigma-70 family RNA polymerase sigma factor [Arthrobacter ipis]
MDGDRRSQLLHRAYRSLGRQDQEVIALCVLEDMTTAEVSELLGIPSGTVKSRLSRAKRRLSQLMNPQTGFLPPTAPLTSEEETP